MAEKEKEGKEEKEADELKLTDIPGIGPGTAAKLEAAGIFDIMGIAVLSPPALSELAGVGEAAARKAIQAARQVEQGKGQEAPSEGPRLAKGEARQRALFRESPQPV